MTGTPGRPRDPRGRPYKIFTAVVELADKLDLVVVRAHDPAHAADLASKQASRKHGGLVHHQVRTVLHGTAKAAT